MKTKPYLLLAMSAGILATATGCDSASAGISPQESHAIFSSFNYEGHDDFYADNPLASDSAFYNPILPGWYSDPSVCSNGKGDYYLVTQPSATFPACPSSTAATLSTGSRQATS